MTDGRRMGGREMREDNSTFSKLRTAKIRVSQNSSSRHVSNGMESVKKVKISVPDRADQTVRSSESSETLSSEYEHSNDIDAATAADFQLIVGMMDGDDSSSNPSLRNSLSNSNSNDNEELPVKKKRGRKPNPFRTRNKSLFTRILKADIRRDYAIMFNNVVNSHEPSMLLRYLKKFAHPDMQMIGDLPDDRNILMSRLAPLQGLFDKRLPPPPGLDLSFLPPTGLDLRVMDNKFVLLGLPSSTVFLLSVQQDTPDSVGIVQDIAIK
eukprot:gene47589-58299_t